MLATIALIGAALALLPEPSQRPRALPDLTYQVDTSTFICVGIVEEVSTVSFPNGIDPTSSLVALRSQQELPFARIRVERVLKGDPLARVVFHEAWSTSRQDATRDALGERCLFLLSPGVIARAHASVRNRAVASLGGDLILRNQDGGHGIVPIQRDGEREHVVQRGWPESLRDSESGVGWDLRRITRWIESAARFSPEATMVHARRDLRRSQSSDFDLRILPDGSRRLVTNGSGTVRVDRIDPTRWARAKALLRPEIVATETISESMGQQRDWRSLTIRGDDKRLSFHQRMESFDGFGDSDRAGLLRALRAWAVVSELLDCPTCADHRADDARFLEGR